MYNPLRIENGETVAPERPGHGVELDWERMKPYLVK
jgi:L-alanine-DL-glutamate epimerase-like enolase superfamily enzyme